MALIDPAKGHGLISTKWYVWCPWFGISLPLQHIGWIERRIRKIELQLQLILIEVEGPGL